MAGVHATWRSKTEHVQNFGIGSGPAVHLPSPSWLSDMPQSAEVVGKIPRTRPGKTRKQPVNHLGDRAFLGMMKKQTMPSGQTVMTEWTSLFAEKLRAHRIGRGEHGRMTQEQLAAALDVSVEAISKYERSRSYIRGDLEHRLIDNLGWSMQDILACREDWEAARDKPSNTTYRLLLNREPLDFFDGSAEAFTQALATLEADDAQDWPDGFTVASPVWAEIQRGSLISGPVVMLGAEIVAHAAIIYPGQVLEKRFRDGVFNEGEIELDLLKRPILPGAYFAYCPAIYIAKGHEAAARLLLSGFVKVLEQLLEREIIIREIAAISVNGLGKQLCEDLGLIHLGKHKLYDAFDNWSFPRARIAASIIGRRSPKLKKAYEESSFEFENS